MNIQEYISSGIIESYVLGLASPEERVEFESMCAAHLEVRMARDAFERSLEQFALSEATIVPAQVRGKVFTDIGIEQGHYGTKGNASDTSGRIASYEPQAQVVSASRWWKYMAAASILLLVTSTALNFYFFNQYKLYNARYDELVAINSELAKNNETYQTRLQEYETAINLMKDPNMAIVIMAGSAVPTSPDPASQATIYWHRQSKDVYLVINQLRVPATDKQYQLWAIVDGKPVDAGIFDVKDGVAYLKMKNIPRAQAFAVTLENRGGSASPTMDQMYVMGKAS